MSKPSPVSPKKLLSVEEQEDHTISAREALAQARKAVDKLRHMTLTGVFTAIKEEVEEKK